MEQLVAHGEVRRGSLGVSLQDLTPDLAAALGLVRNRGALVTRVGPRSPAAQAGLRPGDVILEVNDHDVRSAQHLTNLVGLVPVGGALEIAYWREGEMRRTHATMQGLQHVAVSVARAVPELAGATFRDLHHDGTDGRRLAGVLVAEVEPGSPAWRHGLRAGDIITDVNRRPVGSVEDLLAALNGHNRAIVLDVARGAARLALIIRRRDSPRQIGHARRQQLARQLPM